MGDVSGFDSRRRHFISVCNQPTRSTQPFILSRSINWVVSCNRMFPCTGGAIWWKLTGWKSGVVDWSGRVFASCMPRVQMYVNACNGWPQLALHHWLLPSNCHLLRLYSAIEESDLYIYLCTSMWSKKCHYVNTWVQWHGTFEYEWTATWLQWSQFNLWNDDRLITTALSDTRFAAGFVHGWRHVFT